MDLGEQAHQVKLIIRDRGSSYTAAFNAVLAAAGSDAAAFASSRRNNLAALLRRRYEARGEGFAPRRR